MLLLRLIRLIVGEEYAFFLTAHPQGQKEKGTINGVHHKPHNALLIVWNAELEEIYMGRKEPRLFFPYHYDHSFSFSLLHTHSHIHVHTYFKGIEVSAPSEKQKLCFQILLPDNTKQQKNLCSTHLKMTAEKKRLFTATKVYASGSFQLYTPKKVLFPHMAAFY